MRLYLTLTEAERVVKGYVPWSVRDKIAAKLPPPDPIPGQTTIEEGICTATAGSHDSQTGSATGV